MSYVEAVVQLEDLQMIAERRQDLNRALLELPAPAGDYSDSPAAIEIRTQLHALDSQAFALASTIEAWRAS